MKTLIAAGLAALSLAATSVATADPVYAANDHHPARHAVIVRAPVVYRSGFDRPGFYRAAYMHGRRGAYHHARRHHRGFHIRRPFHRHIA
jgi:hypothetical protein